LNLTGSHTNIDRSRYKHWDDFENLKEGLSTYLPGRLGLADLSLYCVGACCVLLSMFGLVPTWLSCAAIFALPHYISDACTLEMITLKLVMVRICIYIYIYIRIYICVYIHIYIEIYV
jgi:hypothetical protein